MTDVIAAHTVERVRFEIDLIRSLADDPEAAHSHEDMLWKSVLAAIQVGIGDDPRDLAREALLSAEIEFPRWYA